MDVITLAMAKAYTDKKAGYVEVEKVDILNDVTTNSYDEVTFENPIVTGETYIVVFDGVEYERVAQKTNGIFLGNPNCAGTSFDGSYDDPFGIVVDEHPYGYVGAVDTTKSHTISVYQKKETIHPIDPKFLPGVCLPVVEITSAPYPESGVVALSTEESAKLDATVSDGLPVVVKLTAFDMSVAVVCSYLGGEMLSGYIAGHDINFAKADTAWEMGAI